MHSGSRNSAARALDFSHTLGLRSSFICQQHILFRAADNIPESVLELAP